MASEFIWVDHLEDIARAARAMEKQWKELNESEIPGNMSDLTYALPKSVAVELYGPTNWRVGFDDESEAWGLFVDEKTEVPF